MEHLRDFTNEFDYQAIQSGTDLYNSVNTSYKLNWSIANYSSPEYKKVLLEVTWIKRDGSQGSINLDSKIAKVDTKLSGYIMTVPQISEPLTPP